MSNLTQFIEQLRRRHVFKVAAAYAVVGWLVIEVATTVAPHLLLPEWIPRAIIVFVILGFPVALLLAWAYDITPEGIRATDREESAGGREGAAAGREEAAGAPGDQPPVPGSNAKGPAAALTSKRGLRIAVLALALLSVAAGSWLVVRGSASDEVLAGDALAERVEALADEGRFPDAFALVQAARDHGAVVSPALELRVTDRLTVLTDPSGARVHARRFVPGELEANQPERWEELGETPIRGLTLARGDYLLRLEREGYAPVERLASSETERTGIPPDDVPETLIQARLLPAGEIPADMVFVPGGPYSVASRNLQGLLANLEDFFIDRFPVTNADFARFVEAGGYLEPARWERLRNDQAVPDPDAALRRFVDRTELPGPRGWSGQRPPPDQEDHPVTGVNWYEAAAYCAFRGRRLPTLFEWEKTARDGQISYFATIRLPWGPLSPERAGRLRSNFSGTGTTPVDAFPFGISPYGAYDMAGNAKEWLANATESGRAVTGGSWEDPVYLFPEVGSFPSLSTSASLGFRCVQEVDRATARAEPPGSERLGLAVETPEYEPVGDEAFAGLLSHYTYDRRPPQAEVVERREGPGWTRERIRFLGPDDEWVVAYLYLPSTGRPPYQTLVFVPGASVFFGAGVAEVAEWLLAPMVRSGRAVFSVVMAGMTERPFPPGFQPPEPHTARFRDLMVHHATELRMGLDYLETRDDVDMDALGYVGASWGAGSRLLFAAVDDRYDAVIFVGGGIDERVHPTLPEASNINFAPRIHAPTLLLNGRQDEEHPWLTRALPLWNLLSEPRELVLVEDAGHVPPPHERVPAMLEFLDRILGPVPR